MFFSLSEDLNDKLMFEKTINELQISRNSTKRRIIDSDQDISFQLLSVS